MGKSSGQRTTRHERTFRSVLRNDARNGVKGHKPSLRHEHENIDDRVAGPLHGGRPFALTTYRNGGRDHARALQRSQVRSVFFLRLLAVYSSDILLSRRTAFSIGISAMPHRTPIHNLSTHQERYITVSELAEYWLVSRKDIYKQIDAGTLRAIKLGPRVLRSVLLRRGNSSTAPTCVRSHRRLEARRIALGARRHVAR